MSEIKEEARLLIEKFRKALINLHGDSNVVDDTTKQCAIIACDLKLELIDKLIESGLNNDFDLLIKRGEIMSHKNEIEKL